LLALDLMAAGWELGYVDHVVAYHHPALDPRPGRSPRQVRNALWTAWLRRPVPSAARATVSTILAARRDGDVRPGLATAVAGFPWLVAERNRVPAAVERAVTACAVAG